MRLYVTARRFPPRVASAGRDNRSEMAIQFGSLIARRILLINKCYTRYSFSHIELNLLLKLHLKLNKININLLLYHVWTCAMP